MFSQPNKVVKSPPEITILDLPDDCLAQIFNYLRISDLSAVHESTTRFRTAAHRCFLSNHKVLDITLYNDGNCLLQIDNFFRGFGDERYTCLEKIFQIFGKLIIALSFLGSRRFYANDITPVLSLANKYCGENLKYLHMKYVLVDESQIGDLRDFFGHLEIIEIDDRQEVFDISIVERCLRNCMNLKQLTLLKEEEEMNGWILRGVVSKLEKITYITNDGRIETDIIYDFVHQQPNLRWLRLTKIPFPITKHLTHLNNLHTLMIDLSADREQDISKLNWSELFNLKNLKQLEIFSDKHTVTDALLQTAPTPVSNIETLVLHIFHLRDVYNFLKAFTYTNLRRFIVNFHWGIVNDNKLKAKAIDNLAENLYNVRELAFMNTAVSLFEYILQFVKNGRYLDTLCCSPGTIQELIVCDDGVSFMEMYRRKSRRLKMEFDDALKKALEAALDRKLNLNIVQLDYRYLG